MASIINATSSGLTSTADTSGIAKVQSNGVTVTALAWVNFDGTLTTPITPRSNYNVSSVTKNGTGNYTLNFANALADTNYSVVGMGGSVNTTHTNFILGMFSNSTKTTTALQVGVTNGGTITLVDVNTICVGIFGNG